ncbi:DNA polymerase ligase N-terminal domain-containing protein [Legionella bozemanae]|uniref:DNA polymerase ligase N-terminal domain-containing protein n=1 Tax=Legionella bozemanae TaxID=447 RepID=UPI003EE8D5EE
MSRNKQLKDYQQKRDFRKTKEPQGTTSKKKKHIFVIQKHDASHLHYDFRLQNDNVLISWAIPKGLSTAANKKRLAIRTEDHPLDYAKFEGIIPEWEYGAGTVMVWDFGHYELIEDKKTMEKALKEGALKFFLHGEKIKGGYAMARTQQKKDKEQWVIFKLDDDEADARKKPVRTKPNSVLTGRSLNEIAKEEKKDE